MLRNRPETKPLKQGLRSSDQRKPVDLSIKYMSREAEDLRRKTGQVQKQKSSDQKSEKTNYEKSSTNSRQDKKSCEKSKELDYKTRDKMTKQEKKWFSEKFKLEKVENRPPSAATDVLKGPVSKGENLSPPPFKTALVSIMTGSPPSANPIKIEPLKNELGNFKIPHPPTQGKKTIGKESSKSLSPHKKTSSSNQSPKKAIVSINPDIKPDPIPQKKIIIISDRS